MQHAASVSGDAPWRPGRRVEYLALSQALARLAPEAVITADDASGSWQAQYDAVTRALAEVRERQIARRRARAIARRLRIAYWPALLWRGPHGERLPVWAIRLAERVLTRLAGGHYAPPRCWGGWDAMGDHGISPDALHRILQRHRDSRVVAALVAAVYHGVVAPVRRSDSAERALAITRGALWAHRRGYRCARSAALALGRLSVALRWAAVRDVPRDRLLTRDALRLELVAEAQRHRRLSHRLAAAGAPSRVWWRVIRGHDMPAGLPADAVPGAAKESVYAALCERVGVDPWRGAEPADAQGLRASAWTLARIAASPVEAERLVMVSYGEVTPRAVHDAGVVAPPAGGWTRKAWCDLALRHGREVLHAARLWAAIEEIDGRVPADLAELREAVARVRLARDPRDVDGSLRAAAGEAGLDQLAYEQYVTWWLATRQPAALASESGVPAPMAGPVERLVDGDPIAPLLGIITHCCQHPTGAAASVARALATGHMAAWVVRAPGGRIVQQAAVWRSGGMLVIDSIEGHRYPGDAAHWRTAAESVIGHLGVTSVVVGAAYGAMSLADALRREGTASVHPAGCPAEYTDARTAYVVAGIEVA